MEGVEEQVIQLRGDEQQPDGEVFLGDVPDEAIVGDEPPAADEAEASIEVPVAEAITAAAQALDAERAGDAARPQYQPSIPGILPAFDWRRAQLTTESLEENVADAENQWEAAKKTAAARKSVFDDAVDALREHIQATHRARIDAEYQHGKGDGPIAPAPEGEPTKPAACWTEQKTGRPCSICRNLASAPTNGETAQHVAAAAAVDANAGTLDAFGMAASIGAVTGVIVTAESLSLWERDDFKAVARYLEEVAALATTDDADLGTVIRPEILGRQHEVGEDGACRVCGAALMVDDVHLAAGQLVGLDCSGEAAEPAPKATPRHRKPADRQKAKQARGSKDHAAEQKAEGAKKAASESKKKTAGTSKGRKR